MSPVELVVVDTGTRVHVAEHGDIRCLCGMPRLWRWTLRAPIAWRQAGDKRCRQCAGRLHTTGRRYRLVGRRHSDDPIDIP